MCFHFRLSFLLDWKGALTLKLRVFFFPKQFCSLIFISVRESLIFSVCFIHINQFESRKSSYS